MSPRPLKERSDGRRARGGAGLRLGSSPTRERDESEADERGRARFGYDDVEVQRVDKVEGVAAAGGADIESEIACAADGEAAEANAAEAAAGDSVEVHGRRAECRRGHHAAAAIKLFVGASDRAGRSISDQQAAAAK